MSTVLHTVQNKGDVASIYSALYAGSVQNSSIPDQGSMNVPDHFRFFCRTSRIAEKVNNRTARRSDVTDSMFIWAEIARIQFSTVKLGTVGQKLIRVVKFHLVIV